MDEFKLIDKIKQKSYRQTGIVKGIGDDAAVFRTSEKDIVTAVDTFVEDVHFTKKTLSPKQIGYRALAANLSDLAAMGAVPLYYLVSIVIPKQMSNDQVAQIFAGMEELAQQFQIDLIGGDTVSGKELVVSITVIGEVEKDKARYRSHARVDDVIFVTGTLGDARAGLELLLHQVDLQLHPTLRDQLIFKHQQPTPQIKFARGLIPLEHLALNDISDGIANELHEIAAASEVTLVVDGEKIPISEGLKQFPKEKQVEWKLFGGEDFELVGTVKREAFPFVKEIAEKVSVTVTEIGNVAYNRHRQGQVLIKENGRLQPLQKLGYIHRN